MCTIAGGIVYGVVNELECSVVVQTASVLTLSFLCGGLLGTLTQASSKTAFQTVAAMYAWAGMMCWLQVWFIFARTSSVDFVLLAIGLSLFVLASLFWCQAVSGYQARR